jgi:hypothetical protein
MNCFVIPVVIGATEIVAKGLTIYVEAIPGKHSEFLQKSALMKISHVIMKVLES